MRCEKFILVIIFISLIASVTTGSTNDAKYSAILVVSLRDYQTEQPLSNITLEITISAAGVGIRTFKLRTNSTGQAMITLETSVLELSPRLISLAIEALRVNNKTYPLVVMKVCNTLIEFEEGFEAYYEFYDNLTIYDEFDIPLIEITYVNKTVIRCDIWVLKGRIID